MDVFMWVRESEICLLRTSALLWKVYLEESFSHTVVTWLGVAGAVQHLLHLRVGDLHEVKPVTAASD